MEQGTLDCENNTVRVGDVVRITSARTLQTNQPAITMLYYDLPARTVLVMLMLEGGIKSKFLARNVGVYPTSHP